MLIILSAQWPEARIETAFGRVPLPFLPLGATNCLAVQRRMAPADGCIVTLPRDFLDAAEARLAFDTGDVSLLPQPGGLSYAAMLADALQRIATDGPVRILFGDTLLPTPTIRCADFVAVTEAGVAGPGLTFDPGAPPGARFGNAEGPRRLSVCGGFGAADAALLADAMRGGNLREGLNAYDRRRPFEPWITSRTTLATLEGYLQAKSRSLYSRAFNAVAREGNRIVKHSRNDAKIAAEARWYETLPAQLHDTIPAYLGRTGRTDREEYALAFLELPTLGELSVFGAAPTGTWQTIVSACCTLLQRYQSIRPHPGDAAASPDFASAFHRAMHAGKTRARIAAYLRSVESGDGGKAITLNGRRHPPVGEVVEELIATIRPTRPDDVRFWHGDFHYGNLLFEASSGRIFSVDPRGQLEGGGVTSFGDFRYDVAKLAHSVLGRYDRILMGAARLTIDESSCWHFTTRELPEDAAVEAQFVDACRSQFGMERAELLSLTALLFFSMLPLHGERPDLQRMFLAAGLVLAGRARTEP